MYLGLNFFVLRTGLEPVSSRVKGGCPNQLDERSILDVAVLREPQLIQQVRYLGFLTYIHLQSGQDLNLYLPYQYGAFLYAT